MATVRLYSLVFVNKYSRIRCVGTYTQGQGVKQLNKVIYFGCVIYKKHLSQVGKFVLYVTFYTQRQFVKQLRSYTW